MKWSHTLPRQAGYFWIRDHKRDLPEQVVEVEVVAKMGLLAQKELCFDGEPISSFPRTTEWAGPIRKPSN